MTDASPITEAAELESTLAKLEEALKEQVDQVARDDYDAFLELGESVAGMLQRVTAAEAHITQAAHETIRRIHGLHQKLGLSLKTRSAETAQNLQRLNRGKTGLKAYKNA